MIIPYKEFEEMLSHLNYDEWIKQIVHMVRFVNSHGMNAEAALIYEYLFGVKTPTIPLGVKLRMYWKCYKWSDI